ncbi:DUF2129 domain-containing protein [Pseudolactococcus plantarum]|uniref:YlbG family protein n=1 Tax=Pseudolactococcus plantarum TaxID=1365 RepID=UPI0008355BD2|nr:YlbG family protein [Lactococcus plantarum]HCN74571.1 DUF2129 domain-containing protein [Lactococcus sp.]
MENTTLVAEQSKVPTMEIKGRTAMYIFYNSYKHVRQLSNYGELVYSSKKARYAMLYVDTASLDEVLPKITNLHFVHDVKVSQFDQINKDFSSAFQQIVATDKKTVDD